MAKLPSLSPLVARKIGRKNDRPLWRLMEDLVYVTADGTEYKAEAGFITDFASVPRMPLAYLVAGDTAHEAAVIHDWLYRYNGVSRKKADQIFYDIILLTGEPRWRAYAMWLMVRAFAGAKWNEYRKGDK